MCSTVGSQARVEFYVQGLGLWLLPEGSVLFWDFSLQCKAPLVRILVSRRKKVQSLFGRKLSLSLLLVSSLELGSNIETT